MSRAERERRLTKLKASLPAETCCLDGLDGYNYCWAHHQKHLDEPDPRPMPPCRRNGGAPCEFALSTPGIKTEPPYNGPYEFTEEEL